MDGLLSAISSVGFPIVMCLIMLYFMREETTKHDNEMLQLKDAIANNTLVIQKLIDKLDSYEKK